MEKSKNNVPNIKKYIEDYIEYVVEDLGGNAKSMITMTLNQDNLAIAIKIVDGERIFIQNITVDSDDDLDVRFDELKLLKNLN